MGRSPYQSEKRRKELARLKKQEEKRQRRFNKKHGTETAEGGTDETSTAEGLGIEGQPEGAPEGDAPLTPQENKDPDQVH